MKVTINYEDVETLTVRLANSFFGLGYDELDDEYEERGLKLGVSHTIELTIREEEAQELCLRLLETLFEGHQQ